MHTALLDQCVAAMLPVPAQPDQPCLSLPQCRPSKGRKRGFCWCVDKYGQPLPGYDTKGKDDVHCLSVQSQ